MNFFLLGKKIRNLRNMHHFSQADLAELIDVSTNYIGQIERGDRKPSLETLVSLCSVLNTTMDYLLSDSIQKNEDQISIDILDKLSSLSSEEKEFFYHTLCNYIQLQKNPSLPSNTRNYNKKSPPDQT